MVMGVRAARGQHYSHSPAYSDPAFSTTPSVVLLDSARVATYSLNASLCPPISARATSFVNEPNFRHSAFYVSVYRITAIVYRSHTKKTATFQRIYILRFHIQGTIVCYNGHILI